MSLDSLVDKTEIITTEIISQGPPDRVDDEDLPYLQVVADQLEQVPQLQAQVEALTTRIHAIQGASDSYLVYLFTKYGYDPQRTSIERDGTFTVRD